MKIDKLWNGEICYGDLTLTKEARRWSDGGQKF